MADALLIIDFQNDFTPGGALAVDEGDRIGEPIQRLAPHFDVVAATRDWHPPNHLSFKEQGVPWPVHCVRDTSGAQLHPELDSTQIQAIIDAGREPEHEGYSGFEHTDLERVLRDHDVDTVHVGGLALDYCVKETALDARRAGFDVVLHRDATRAINAVEGDDQRAIEELRAAGVRVVP